MMAASLGLWRVDCLMLKPATLYFGLTFAAGFAFGTVRQLVVSPWLGEVAAVLIECPFMLLASYLVARWVVRWFALDAGVGRRLLIGVTAFVMLMVAEVAMSWARGVWPREFVASLLTTAGAIGLWAQVVFAAMPVFVGTHDATRS